MMKTHELRINKRFEQVLEHARDAIRQSGFLVLHEINTAAIMRGAGYVVGEVRQLLFFHPRYMIVILERDPASVIRAPLKIVVQSVSEDETMVTYVHPDDLFADKAVLKVMAAELGKQVDEIAGSLRVNAGRHIGV